MFAWLLSIYFLLITLDHRQENSTENKHNHQLLLPADIFSFEYQNELKKRDLILSSQTDSLS